jgi:hypothetical protein
MSLQIKEVNENHQENVNTYKRELENELLEQYKNNEYLKVSLLNIDSAHRNKIPQNVLENGFKILDNNPITITKDSNEIKIYYPEHNLKIGDKIVLQNIKTKNYILQDCLIFIKDFDYLLININDHKINNNELIEIINYNDISVNKRLIGNIQINLILGFQRVNLFDNISISEIILNLILNDLNINQQNLNKNYIFLKLPYSYLNINEISNNTILKNTFHIKTKNIGGILTEYLNANYPINSSQLKSSHIISKVETDYIYYISDNYGIFDETGGGNSVKIGKIINEIDGYIDSNDYKINLKNSFTNVVRIELVSSEIPYIEFNVNNVTNKNNKLYWKYLDDGTHIYSTSLPSGNYTSTGIIEKIKEKINSIERIESTLNKKIYNNIDIKINTNSQEVIFKAFKSYNISNSLSVVQDDLNKDIYTLNIKIKNTNLNIGDKIILKKANTIGDIGSRILNQEHTIYKIDKINETISVILIFNSVGNEIDIEGDGGISTEIKLPDKFQLLFNYNDTLGKLLGFRNVGMTNSITPFKNKISNFDDYIIKDIYNEVGNQLEENLFLNFTSINYYMYMYLNDFEGVISNTNLPNPFAKIILSGNSGEVMFDTFINSPLEFDIPIPILNELNIKFLYQDGSKPTFLTFNHSFTLRITEKLTEPNRTRELSTRQNYNETLMTRHFLDENLVKLRNNINTNNN